ncbi:long-chain-fatty-acid--CoA ligase [Janthinobacterium lividum]|jgi:long-chain acyl-CoA synthetase|uniref:Long-chain-fatty-acid--CoA ligase n=1 Tax=Janthinobacterium lividum TaxID=29581 RepID=A0AAJ4MSL1_9BURK|nr:MULTISPECIES: long-chain-fatty-acid--CoA ligase [Janthinobacterium]KAB0327244.1 long-chain-fatty-acid--CoA ligase [Janthinobacterium lividum]MBR7633590.1 long-chain-fatty-acid--CoA ligase [Janthinobacterium lividum]MCC7694944.1 long-chain-fatty-acid--CoA ligase [Janthinobacterium sp. EB271-G4-7A]MCC7717094.1 long-chain-fatty-acid--CoA ligase [Janthinobacterium lividum]MDO8035698.1 long-chain-fatty-acid--CoA ligase [Janthinobacterium sp. SUN128]
MDKIWLKSYPDSVPAEIDCTQYRSVTHLLEESFQKYADRNAFVCMDKFLTYRELDKLSLQMGAWLQSKGLKTGARVAIMLPNVLQYPVAMAAILRAGYTVVNVNPLYTPRELQHQLVDSGSEAIIVLENFATTVEQVLPHTQVKHVIVATMGDMLGGLKGTIVNFVVRKIKKMVPAFSLPGAISFNKMLAEGARLSLTPVQQGHDDIVFLQYTGGTTGVSKGAMLLHRNVIANVLQNEAWISPVMTKEMRATSMGFMCALPLYHIYSLTVSALMGMRVGGLNVLIPNPRDIPGFVKELSKHKIVVFPAVNTLYNALLNNADFAKLDFSSYKVCNGGGMALQRNVAERWLKLTGCPLIEGYGMSETSPVVTGNRVDITEFTGTIGLPFPSTEVAILNDDGVEVPLGEPGEIAVRGPQVMAGYWQRPDETAKSMTADGFFKTGDVGVMDERGYVKIVDRKKDMIIVSGFNVYPNEVEDVVASCPGVLECACIGVPDANAGEAVKVFVVRKDPNLTVEQIREHCKHELTAYKKPKYIEFRDELPKTNVGKILRRQLRDEKKVA